MWFFINFIEINWIAIIFEVKRLIIFLINKYPDKMSRVSSSTLSTARFESRVIDSNIKN